MSAYTDGCTLYPFSDDAGVCDRCGTPLTGRQTRWCSKTCSASIAENHYWNQARWAAMRRDGGKCVRCGNPGHEVNHIVPRNGAGYGSGCWHHLDGLETLCHSCHVAVTNEQARERKLVS